MEEVWALLLKQLSAGDCELRMPRHQLKLQFNPAGSQLDIAIEKQHELGGTMRGPDVPACGGARIFRFYDDLNRRIPLPDELRRPIGRQPVDERARSGSHGLLTYGIQSPPDNV